MSETEPDNARDGRIKLLGLAAVFVVPVLVAVALYFAAPHWAPAPRTHGELIDPPRPVEAFRVPTATGSTYDLERLRGHWTLLHTVEGTCGPQCRERLYYTRQIHDALAEDRIRVRRVVLAARGGDTPGLARVLGDHPDLTVLARSPERALWAQVPAPRGNATVFLVDPLGNVMMRFGPDIKPDHILEDIEHALEVSRIG